MSGLKKTKALVKRPITGWWTKRAQAVEDLLEADKVALFSDATHHLSNPLNHITEAVKSSVVNWY